MEKSPNFEHRFSQINIQNGTDDRKKSRPKMTVPKSPYLSTSKRAETRAITRSQSSINISSLHIAKTPSRILNNKAVLTIKTSKIALVDQLNDSKSTGNTPYQELSYMRDTSSSLRKVSNPFNNNSNGHSIGPKPSDITNINLQETSKASPIRHVPRSITTDKLDVYTRLYNDSKKLQAPLNSRYFSRTNSTFHMEKILVKVQNLAELYRIIHEEDPCLFEDNTNEVLIANEPKTSQQVIQEFDSQLIQHSPLDTYEKGEISRRNDIYFFPSTNSQNRKINITNYINNYGFDDTSGNYVIVPQDHINYRYQIISVLGNGAFGNVVKCIDKKYSNENGNKVVAIKIIKNDLNWSLQAIYEIKMLKHLNDINDTQSNDPYINDYSTQKNAVLKYYTHFHFRGHMCIVTEPLTINLYSLLEVIKFQGLSLPLIKIFTRKILEGLEFIHSKNIIHCDIKPENIMVKLPPKFNTTVVDDDSIIIKIIDFGSSCFTNEISYTYIQSRFYRAPEIIIGAKYDNMIDIWSTGCIIAELFTGDPLLPGKNELEQIGLILELFGSPNSSLILHQRAQLIKSIRGQNAISNINDLGNVAFKGVVANEKSIKKTLLYTLFDMEGKINMNFLNMRIQAAANTQSHQYLSSKRKFKASSKTLEFKLKLNASHEDKKMCQEFLGFLGKIFKWSPDKRASAKELLNDNFINM